MLCFDRIDNSEDIDVSKTVHQQSVIFVAIGVSQIIVLSFNQMSAIDAMIYEWCLWTLAVLLF